MFVDRPQDVVLDRSPNEHLAFGGGGPHFCLGSHFGRIEAGEMLHLGSDPRAGDVHARG